MLWVGGILTGLAFVLLGAFSVLVHPYGVVKRSPWDFFIAFGIGAGTGLLLILAFGVIGAFLWPKD